MCKGKPVIKDHTCITPSIGNIQKRQSYKQNITLGVIPGAKWRVTLNTYTVSFGCGKDTENGKMMVI